MFVKSDWGGWLVLTAVVVFPAMLYLTRMAPRDSVGSTTHTDVNRSETVPAQSRENKQAALPAEGSAHAMPSENTAALSQASDSDSAPTGRADISSNIATISTDESVTPRRETTDRAGDEITSQPESYSNESDNSSVESPSESIASVNYYNISGGNTNVNSQETATTAVGSPATVTTGSTQKQSVSSRVSSPGSANNSILSPLYTAQIDPPPKIKPKCPPVYMGINAYARNMRIAMGCNDN